MLPALKAIQISSQDATSFHMECGQVGLPQGEQRVLFPATGCCRRTFSRWEEKASHCPQQSVLGGSRDATAEKKLRSKLLFCVWDGKSPGPSGDSGGLFFQVE